MDINHLLLWIVGLSCATTLLRAGRLSSRHNQGWGVVSGLVLLVTTAAIFLVPDRAGLVGGVLWMLFLLLPSLGIRQVALLTYQDHYHSASRLAAVLSWLHPADGWREYPNILRAIALGQQGKLEQAIALLAPYQSHKTQIGRLAMLSQYRLEGRWEDLLQWFYKHNLTQMLGTEPSLTPHYLRALGETGDLAGLLQNLEQLTPAFEKTGNIKILNLVRLFTLSFCGQPDQVRELLERSFSSYSNQIRQFWLATAEMAAGQAQQAQQRFLAIQHDSDPIMKRAIAQRLQRPVVNARQTLTAVDYQTLTQLELEAEQEARYGKPFTFISKRAYATYGIIGCNLLIFGLEQAAGGTQNLETLYHLGALVPTIVWQGEWWRLLAANFLHFGPLHLAMNMLGLYFLGGFVESTLGVGRYLVTYFFSGVGAMFLITFLAIWLHSPEQILVGASAAIMGLVGATGAIMLYGWRQEKSRIAAKNFRLLLFVIGIQVAFDLSTPGVSFLGHTLGLILGFLGCSLLLWNQPLTNQRVQL